MSFRGWPLPPPSSAATIDRVTGTYPDTWYRTQRTTRDAGLVRPRPGTFLPQNLTFASESDLDSHLKTLKQRHPNHCKDLALSSLEFFKMEWNKYKQSDEAGRLEIEQLEKVIGLKEREILMLQLDVQKNQLPVPPSLAAGSSTARRTTTTAALAREEYELVLAQHQDTGDSWDKLQNVSPNDAYHFIQEKSRDPVCDKDGGFGCWITRGRDKEGYVSAQITVTRKDPDLNYRLLQGPRVVVNTRLHVLAMLAKDALDGPAKYGLAHQALKGTHRYGTHHVSHLCHDNRCFNPQHLVVETCALNLARNKCQGHQILRIYYPSPNGGYQNEYVEWHPCRHGRSENRALCILPVRVIRVPIPGFDGVPRGVRLERADWMFRNGEKKAWNWFAGSWSREDEFEPKTWKEDNEGVD